MPEHHKMKIRIVVRAPSAQIREPEDETRIELAADRREPETNPARGTTNQRPLAFSLSALAIVLSAGAASWYLWPHGATAKSPAAEAADSAIAPKPAQPRANVARPIALEATSIESAAEPVPGAIETMPTVLAGTSSPSARRSIAEELPLRGESSTNPPQLATQAPHNLTDTAVFEVGNPSVANAPTPQELPSANLGPGRETAVADPAPRRAESRPPPLDTVAQTLANGLETAGSHGQNGAIDNDRPVPPAPLKVAGSTPAAPLSTPSKKPTNEGDGFPTAGRGEVVPEPTETIEPPALEPESQGARRTFQEDDASPLTEVETQLALAATMPVVEQRTIQQATDRVLSEAVARAQLSNGIYRREPTEKPAAPIMVPGPGSRKLYYFTELRGLEGQTIRHRWIYDGRTVATLRFRVGGDRWRLYSSKNLSTRMDGEWRVVAEDPNGRVLSESRFQVVADDGGAG